MKLGIGKQRIYDHRLLLCFGYLRCVRLGPSGVEILPELLKYLVCGLPKDVFDNLTHCVETVPVQNRPAFLILFTTLRECHIDICFLLTAKRPL